ncbi:uncharacterized protein N7484_006741 [Penicillium longicatenatum]|uniref:uncharacterized protein n=1 Tax=Penicillium longicatenatum TaxID=1561947 RepID=UPI002546E1E5|nr:uncharacterized protein N7484_006741 [Penicillium longicatenatum]KAJ5644234.1 hypothetical protein N7484_006741 [Penicillium longicatenatum]
MAEILPSATQQPICLTSACVASWSDEDAFRELYQNWKDAIMQDHNLPPLGFPVATTETDKEILLIVPKPIPTGSTNQASYAGFICFKKATGVIELTNFDSLLDTRCLEIGYSAKSGDVRLIGHHGEGLKLAALAFSRKQYHVKVCANSCYWNFTFRGRESRNFYCTITPASREKTHRLKAKFAKNEEENLPRELIANIWRDVSVVIKRDSAVHRLDEYDFWRWMQVTIDIKPPPGLIRTLVGDLILDEGYRGNIYVKGIRYADCGSYDGEFRIGYNLGTGLIHRERCIGMCPTTQRCITEIWARAIEKGAANVVALYSQILMETPDAMDVRNFEELVNKSTARSVWVHLREDAKIRGLFYHPPDVGEPAIQNIQRRLELQPTSMPTSLWRLLRQFKLISTTDEELASRLKSSGKIQIPDTLFSRQFDRALRGLLAAEAQTQEIQIVYVQGCKGGITLTLVEGALYVHQQWLDPQSSHADSPCPLFSKQDAESWFFCDHVIEDAYFEVLSLLQEHIFVVSTEVPVLRRRGLQRLHDMPRAVRAKTTSGSVIVQWDVGHSHAFAEAYGAYIQYRVTLHDIQCLVQRDSLLYSNSSYCSCPTKDVALNDKTVAFYPCESSITFPVISRNCEGSICGIPPAPVPTNSKSDLKDMVEVPVNNRYTPHGSIVEIANSSTGTSDLDCSTMSDSVFLEQTSLDVTDSLWPDPTIQSHAESRVIELKKWMIEETQRERLTDWETCGSVHGLQGLWPSHASVCDGQSVPLQTPQSAGTIKTQQYLGVTLSRSGGQQRCVLFVHEIIFQPGEDKLVHSLRATRFSFLSDCCTTSPDIALPGEVVLHFHDLSIIGESADADIILFEELLSWDPSTVVKFVDQPSFSAVCHVCRFAITGDEILTASWIPLLQAPSHEGAIPLSHPPPCFSAVPMVRDMCPEKITHIGELIKIGLKRVFSIYSDSQEGILPREAEQTLIMLHADGWVPDCSPNELDDDENNSLDKILSPFNMVRGILDSAQRPDFFVLVLPLAILHPFATYNLMKEILFLLRQEYSVHLKMMPSALDETERIFVGIVAPPGTDPRALDQASNEVVQLRAGLCTLPEERASWEPSCLDPRSIETFDCADTLSEPMIAAGQKLGETILDIVKAGMQHPKRRSTSSPPGEYPMPLKRARRLE